jgi:manganese oxidase
LGLFTAGGLLIPKQGLSPFAKSAYADSGSGIPTGAPPSPGLVSLEFTQPMPRFDVLPRRPLASLTPARTAQANTTLQAVDPLSGGGQGPIEGRPPGPIWAHQRSSQFPPQVAVEATQEGAKTNIVFNPGVPASLNPGIDQTHPLPLKFRPSLPPQSPLAVWTFNSWTGGKPRRREGVTQRRRPSPSVRGSTSLQSGVVPAILSTMGTGWGRTYGA